jgi:DNA-binding FadR family transcriptional regulator
MADDPASVQLADQIAVQIRAGRLMPGAVVASEQDLRSHHETGRSLLRQAVRILKERGVAYMRRGHGGGLVVAQPNPEFASRALAIAIESRMQGPAGLDPLLKATDTHMFLSGALKLDPVACDEIRRLAAHLNTLSQEAFQQAGGHREMTRALRGLFGDPVVALAYQTTAEYGIDLLPYSALVAEEGSRSELWDLTLQMVEALIAADIAALFDLRGRQQAVLQARWRVWSAIENERRVVPAIDTAEGAWAQSADNRAERLAREILRDVRLIGWKPGYRIGGAAELMDRYGATVGTVRQAVRLLEEHSAVRMERGRNGGLFIAQPDAATAVDRALAYLALTDAEAGDVKGFLIQLVLDVVTQLADRRLPAAEMRPAIHGARARPSAAADRSLYRALARLAGNAALEIFVDILTGLLPADGKGGPPEDLTTILQAVGAGDGPRARRAFLHYARSGSLLGQAAGGAG